MKTFSAFRGTKALVAAGLMLGIISTAHAYTAEQQQLCTDDAFRLCSSEIPNVDRVTACMVQHKAELSAGCKSVFSPGPAAQAAPTANTTQVKASKPMNLVPGKRAGT